MLRRYSVRKKNSNILLFKGESRTAALSKVELFMINGFQPLTIITKSSTLDVAAVLDLPLPLCLKNNISLLKYPDMPQNWRSTARSFERQFWGISGYFKRSLFTGVLWNKCSEKFHKSVMKLSFLKLKVYCCYII